MQNENCKFARAHRLDCYNLRSSVAAPFCSEPRNAPEQDPAGQERWPPDRIGQAINNHSGRAAQSKHSTRNPRRNAKGPAGNDVARWPD